MKGRCDTAHVDCHLHLCQLYTHDLLYTHYTMRRSVPRGRNLLGSALYYHEICVRHLISVMSSHCGFVVRVSNMRDAIECTRTLFKWCAG